MSNEVKLLTRFFPIPQSWKIEGSKHVPDDIIMIYDATRSGLNKAVWVPWFSIRKVVVYLSSVVAVTYIADCDVGDIHFNFILEPQIRPYVGLYLTYLYPEDISAQNFY